MPKQVPPPDPNPRKPNLRLPAGAVDSHIHLFGPSSQYAFHPDSRYVSEDALPETYIAMQEVLGLTRAVVVSGGGYGPDFRHLSAVLERFPERFRGVALLPETASAAEIRNLDRLGVRGARFHSPKHGGSIPELSKQTASKIADQGWHVQFYPYRGDLVEYADQLMDLPNVIVLDHFASVPAEEGVDHPSFQTLLRMLDSGRVWVKLSGPMRCFQGDPPYACVTPMAQALVRHAPERLVWGTDWPHVNMTGRVMPNDGDLVDLLAEWVPDPETRHRILVANPCELYGFEPPAAAGQG
ncbi:4-sulfomuconolactone hydrolase [Pigmentiphaga humi]|uniref:4-sulfomuconolactone hydrolase n=1 Tax=Pigmentiphaga humi TaxID=2478468 RepID=A0A3P4B597_9BURK|nr:amidohydrolase family protein [Pigmentiphaga humi]VCU71464.1 4-sulfomuconolactone hydrolase [Pigmentiphaga humi]